MYGKVFSRIAVLSVALIIFIFSCGYVAFSNEKTLTQPHSHFQVSVLKGKPDDVSKKFLHHPRLAISKRVMIVAATYFVVSLLFFGFKRNSLPEALYLNLNPVVSNRVLWLRMWRI